MRITLAAAALLAASTGCMSAEEEACHDTYGWIADAYVRCTGDQASRQQLIDSMQQQQSCDNVKAVRDRPALYGCCQDFLRSVDCAVVQSPSFAQQMPECCKGQLLF